jgi:PAS domain S-box-containing protein
MSTPPIRVLAVDDELELGNLSKEFLEMQGDIEVHTVNSVAEARAAVSAFRYDAIVSDYQMPVEDGLQFLKSLRASGNQIPFILFTGKGREEVVIEALNNGADSYLQKGGMPAPMYVELQHRIRTAVRKRQADLEVEQRNRKLQKANKELATAKLELSSQLEAIRAGQEAMAAAEEELRVSETRYRSLFEGMLNGAAVHEIILDDDGIPIDYRFLNLNASFEEMTGLDRANIIGSTVREALKEVEPIWIERYGKVALTGIPDRFDNYAQALDRHYEVSVYRNAPMQFTVIMTDVTIRKKAERDLKGSEEKFKAIANYAASWEAWYNSDGNLLWMNSYSIALTGYTPEEYIVAQDFIKMAVAEEDRLLASEKMREAAMGGSGDNLEIRALRKDGSKFWISISWRPILDSNGVSLGFRTSSQDITERKRTEDALRQASLKLGMLNSITRHDILNQMQVLTGFLALFKLREKDPELTTYLEKMSRAATNVQQQIAFTKDYQDIGSQTPIWVSIGRQTAEAFIQLHLKGVAWEERTGGVEILIDPLALKVPYNLIDNSMRHGEHVNRIKMSAEQAGDAMVIVYEDNGVGIAPEDKEQIFKKGHGKNTGLGLFLIREVLAITGTTIRECGHQGHGARFEIIVPPGGWRRAILD